MPHEPRALGLDNQQAALIGLFDNETYISTIKRLDLRIYVVDFAILL